MEGAKDSIVLEMFSLLHFGNPGLGFFLLPFIVYLKSLSLRCYEQRSEKVSQLEAAPCDLAALSRAGCVSWVQSWERG